MNYRHIAFYSAGGIRNDPHGSVICGWRARIDPIPAAGAVTSCYVVTRLRKKDPLGSPRGQLPRKVHARAIIRVVSDSRAIPAATLHLEHA